LAVIASAAARPRRWEAEQRSRMNRDLMMNEGLKAIIMRMQDETIFFCLASSGQ
jgi:hypothetical protein